MNIGYCTRSDFFLLFQLYMMKSGNGIHTQEGGQQSQPDNYPQCKSI